MQDVLAFSAADAQLRRRATNVVSSATSFLADHFGKHFDECVSAGVMGSYARNALRAVSDIDYYVVFDEPACAAANVGCSESDMSTVVSGLSEHVRRTHAEEPFAQRFSVYWSSLAALEEGRYDVGRWPAYDRRAFSIYDVHCGGKIVSKTRLPRVPLDAIVVDSACFFLDVARSKLEEANLFGRLNLLTAAELESLGPVILTKSVTMPVRLLHVLHPLKEEQVILGTEAAIAWCAIRYRRERWWALVEAALSWRKYAPADTEGWTDAAALFRAHLRDLYVFSLNEYANALGEKNHVGLSARLAAWRDDLAL
jgi:predicted nucleotidyltransferase